MELLTYSNFNSVAVLSNKEEQEYLEETLISFNYLCQNWKKIKPNLFLLLITFILCFNLGVINNKGKETREKTQGNYLQRSIEQLASFPEKITEHVTDVINNQREIAQKKLELERTFEQESHQQDKEFFTLYDNFVTNNFRGTPQAEGLKKGDQGGEVVALQQKLQQLGYFKGKITGYFGGQTETAVKEFQRSKNLIPDGIAGKNTLNLLNNHNSTTNTKANIPSAINLPIVPGQGIKKGDQGNEVTAIQQKLQQLGYFKGKITGYFGSQTEEAVKQFQRSKNLIPDGIVGRNTLTVLNGGSLNNNNNNNNNNISSTAVKPSINLTSQQIRIMQEQLKRLGYYQGNINGSYGVITHNAIEQFQSNNNLTNTNRNIVENFQSYSSPFGPRRLSVSGPQEWHRGLDFAAPVDSYIRNWHIGRVIELSDHTSCGTLVRIQSGNFEHVYCHLKGSIRSDVNGKYLHDPGSGLNVRLGQTIPTGTRIGRIGMTGRTTGPHLHWGLKYKGEFIDPFLVLLN